MNDGLSLAGFLGLCGICAIGGFLMGTASLGDALSVQEDRFKKNGAITRCFSFEGSERCELICPTAPPIQEVRKP